MLYCTLPAVPLTPEVSWATVRASTTVCWPLYGVNNNCSQEVRRPRQHAMPLTDREDCRTLAFVRLKRCGTRVCCGCQLAIFLCHTCACTRLIILCLGSLCDCWCEGGAHGKDNNTASTLPHCAVGCKAYMYIAMHEYNLHHLLYLSQRRLDPHPYRC